VDGRALEPYPLKGWTSLANALRAGGGGVGLEGGRGGAGGMEEAASGAALAGPLALAPALTLALALACLRGAFVSE
jgi:hypothetical protein